MPDDSRERHPGVGREEAARRDRYLLLAGVAREAGTDLIALAVGEQSSVAEEINRSISSIQALSETNLAMADKSSLAGKRMHAIARSFTELAAQFWNAKHR